MIKFPIPYYLFNSKFPKALCLEITSAINESRNSSHLDQSMFHYAGELSERYPKCRKILLNINWTLLTNTVSSYVHNQNLLIKYIESESALANSYLRKPEKIYVYGRSHSGICNKCTKLVQNRIFLAEELLNQNMRQVVLPLDECSCDGYCRCSWGHIHPNSSYLNHENKITKKDKNPLEWQEWIERNHINITVPISYLPKLSSEEIKSIKNSVLKNEINIIQGNDSIGFSKDDFVQITKDWADEIPFLSEKRKSQIIGDNAEKIGRSKVVSSLIGMLQRYKYCMEKKLDCEELFGFSINLSKNDINNYKFHLTDSIRAKNSFGRLRYFDPSTAQWIKKPEIIESERSEKQDDNTDTKSKNEILYEHGFRIGDYCSLKKFGNGRVYTIVDTGDKIIAADNGYGDIRTYRISDIEKLSKNEAKKLIEIRKNNFNLNK